MGQNASQAVSGPPVLAHTTGNYLADLGGELVYEKRQVRDLRVAWLDIHTSS